MAVNAFAAPRRRAFWKWKWGCLVAQKAFMTQPLGSRARHRPCGNAHRVPRLLERSRQLCLRHHSPNFLRRSLLRPVNRTPEVEAATSFVSRFGSAIGPTRRPRRARALRRRDAGQEPNVRALRSAAFAALTMSLPLSVSPNSVIGDPTTQRCLTRTLSAT